MVFFNVWAENLDKYIFFKNILLIIIGIIIFILFYDIIKIIILSYKKHVDYTKSLGEKKQGIIQDIEKLLLKKGDLFIKSFLFFLEKNVDIGKYSIDNLLERINWNKDDLYKMIYSKEEKSIKENEEKIREVLLDYKKWLER